MQGALARYASAEGHYPDSLEALGAQAQAAAQSALRSGYSLQYAAGTSGSGGGGHTYVLTARPGRYGLLSFFTDQTGAIHSTRENRLATASDPSL